MGPAYEWIKNNPYMKRSRRIAELEEIATSSERWSERWMARDKGYVLKGASYCTDCKVVMDRKLLRGGLCRDCFEIRVKKRRGYYEG